MKTAVALLSIYCAPVFVIVYLVHSFLSSVF